MWFFIECFYQLFPNQVYKAISRGVNIKNIVYFESQVSLPTNQIISFRITFRLLSQMGKQIYSGSDRKIEQGKEARYCQCPLLRRASQFGNSGWVEIFLSNESRSLQTNRRRWRRTQMMSQWQCTRPALRAILRFVILEKDWQPSFIYAGSNDRSFQHRRSDLWARKSARSWVREIILGYRRFSSSIQWNYVHSRSIS